MGKYKLVYMYANNTNTGPIRDGIIRVSKAPYTSPKFFGGRRDTKKLQNKQVGPEWTRHVHNISKAGTEFGTARNWHSTYTCII